MTQEDKEMWKKIKEQQGYIVLITCIIFHYFSYVSLFRAIRIINKKICIRQNKNEKDSFIGGYAFPELWVLGNILCGIVIYILLVYINIPVWLGWTFVILAIMRTFEILIYHVNVLLFDRLKVESRGGEYAIKSPIRMLVLLLINMFEYIICFSIVYLFFITGLNDAYWQSFAMSISAFLNINLPESGKLLSNKWIAVARIESILGIFMNLICIARFINTLPSVKTIDE